jgi:vitamin K-dependent gamma-carboxylase
MLEQFGKFLFKSNDATIVSLFRIIFGCFMIYQMYYYFGLDYTYQFMFGPEVLFPYSGGSFLRPLNLELLQGIHISLFIAAILITLGYWYRYAMILFFIGFSYFSFIDKTLFNNHIYLISLISFVMIFMEADKKYSLRAKFSKKDFYPYIPAWNQYILIFLISLPYFFGGLAKLSPNWLNTSLPEILISESKGSFLYNIFSEDFLIGLITYGGVIYDLSIVFLLLYKRTRWLAVVLVLLFNYTNHSILFNDIGIFPLLMIFSTLLFFDSAIVGRRLDKFLTKKPRKRKFKNKAERKKHKADNDKWVAARQSVTQLEAGPKFILTKKIFTIGIGLFIVFHLLFPLRYLVITDNPEWYGLASRFAWRMKMQTRDVESFTMTLIDRDNGDSGDIEFESFLSTNQLLHLLEDPHNLIQFAKYLSPMIEKNYGITDPIITADIVLSFNGLPAQKMISSTTDLTRLDESVFSDHSWILLLEGTVK